MPSGPTHPGSSRGEPFVLAILGGVLFFFCAKKNCFRLCKSAASLKQNSLRLGMRCKGAKELREPGQMAEKGRAFKLAPVLINGVVARGTVSLLHERIRTHR